MMLFRTTNKNLMERIATNAQKYLPWNWENLNMVQKYAAIQETLDLLSESASTSSIVTEHKSERLIFNSLDKRKAKTAFTFSKKIKTSAAWQPQLNCILLNKKLINNSVELYGILRHEFTHKIQTELSKHIDDYDKNSNEYKYLMSLKELSECKNYVFENMGIKFNGELYLNTSNTPFSFSDHALEEALYRLQLSERSAYASECLAKTFLANLAHENGHKLYVQNDAMKRAYKTLGEQYGNINRDNQDIINLYDGAINNILSDKAPKTIKEASLMYDILVLLEFKNSNKKREVAKDEYVTKMEHNNKQSVLEQLLGIHNRSYVSELPKYSIEQIQELSPGYLTKHQEILISAIADYGYEAVRYIPNEDNFQEYYYEHANELSEKTIDKIASVMGREYSIFAIREFQEMQIKTYHNNEMEVKTEERNNTHAYHLYGFDRNDKSTDDIKQEDYDRKR